MAKRITREDLEAQAKNINQMLCTPAVKYAMDGDKMVWNVGHHMIQGAYEGYRLERVETAGGSTTDALYSGWIKAKDLHPLIDAYIRGIRVSNI